MTKEAEIHKFVLKSINYELYIQADRSQYAGMYDEMTTLCNTRSTSKKIFYKHRKEFKDKLDKYTTQDFVVSQIHAILYYLVHVEHVDLVEGYYRTDVLKIEE